jgi:hypothetical protein
MDELPRQRITKLWVIQGNVKRGTGAEKEREKIQSDIETKMNAVSFWICRLKQGDRTFLQNH